MLPGQYKQKSVEFSQIIVSTCSSGIFLVGSVYCGQYFVSIEIVYFNLQKIYGNNSKPFSYGMTSRLDQLPSGAANNWWCAFPLQIEHPFYSDVYQNFLSHSCMGSSHFTLLLAWAWEVRIVSTPPGTGEKNWNIIQVTVPTHPIWNGNACCFGSWSLHKCQRLTDRLVEMDESKKQHSQDAFSSLTLFYFV